MVITSMSKDSAVTLKRQGTKMVSVADGAVRSVRASFLSSFCHELDLP